MLPVFGWGIGVALAAGAGKLLLDFFEEEACSARSEWQARSAELARKTDEYNRALERQLTTSAQAIEFRRLRNLYQGSIEQANLNYGFLRDGRMYLDQLNQLLRQTMKARKSLRETMQNGHAAEKQEARNRMQALLDFRDQLFEERSGAAERNELRLRQVRDLNSNTRRLKLQIRDNCGHGGRIWFARLEQRRLGSGRAAALMRG